MEHAIEPQDKTWGLMGRTYLPENQGMLFHYTPSICPQIWSFNCYIHLSVAFLNNQRVVFSICDLYAYPEKMDSYRPVRTFQDLRRYSFSDPIVQFYLENSLKTSTPTSYVLEMNLGWFDRNGIKIGDQLDWDGTQGIFRK